MWIWKTFLTSYSSLDAAIDYLLEKFPSWELPLSLASSSNEIPQTPSSSLAQAQALAEASLRSTPLDSEGKQDDFFPFEIGFSGLKPELGIF